MANPFRPGTPVRYIGAANLSHGIVEKKGRNGWIECTFGDIGGVKCAPSNLEVIEVAADAFKADFEQTNTIIARSHLLMAFELANRGRAYRLANKIERILQAEEWTEGEKSEGDAKARAELMQWAYSDGVGFMHLPTGIINDGAETWVELCEEEGL
jgi:hypothetical protein